MDDRRKALQALADLTRLVAERGGDGSAGVREPRRPKPRPPLVGAAWKNI